ncbi:tyrosine-type recombinase/integrase [Rhodocyclus tenuis]|uniref:Integrase n=1 Tax=Rhodocyclus tenuis TaxID=1066 RepID=A0A840GEH6_RHOTE|nr:site-specific integrase [Rhodocyclus tenuis]MBB4249038.1 integrase [Rhodocyclus tenuis]
MAVTNKLTDRKAASLNAPGRFGDGAGLWLQVRSPSAKSWVFRFMLNGKARWLGLGPYPDVTLAEARELAAECRRKLRAGIDPLDEKQAAKRTALAQAVKALTFDECATSYIEAQRAGWKNAKHAAQWQSTLDTYASPIIGKLAVGDVDTACVMRVLEPIWTSKTETASRLRGRIEAVLAWATVRGYRSGDNPATWRNHLDKLLPARSKVQKVEHHAALPWREVGEFMVALRKEAGIAARALELAILCAARSGEVRGATHEEFDLKAKTWIIPAERMKAGKEHHIPLSDAAIAVIKAMPKIEGGAIVFPGVKGKPLSDASLGAVLKRMKRADLTAHGFRSTFRDWAGESTAYPREVIEHALAHQLKDKAEAAYARGTSFDKRRRLMADWAKFCGTGATTGATVTPIKARARSGK